MQGSDIGVIEHAGESVTRRAPGAGRGLREFLLKVLEDWGRVQLFRDEEQPAPPGPLTEVYPAAPGRERNGLPSQNTMTKTF